MRVRTRLVALAAATVLVAACSGDGDGAAPTTTGAVSSTSTPSTSEPTSTSAAPTSAPVTTTTTTPPVPTSSAPPITTTTTPPTSTAPSTTAGSAPPSTTAAELAAEIEADWREAVRRFDAASMDPNDDAKAKAAAEYRSGENLFLVADRINQMRAENQRILPEPSIEPALTLEGGPVPVEDSPGDYSIVVCEVDPWILVQVVDGVETVINDEVIASRSELHMKRIEDRWTIFERTVLGRWDGATCQSA